MTIAAVLFPLCALSLFVWLRRCNQIGEKTFVWLVVALMICISVIVMRPDTFEVNIGGNTLKALRQETERAQEALSALKRLRSDVLSMGLKGIEGIASSRIWLASFTEVKAEEFDQFMFLIEMLPKKEQLDEELHEDVVQACKAVLARQHSMTGLLFVFSDGKDTKWGGFSRADL